MCKQSSCPRNLRLVAGLVWLASLVCSSEAVIGGDNEPVFFGFNAQILKKGVMDCGGIILDDRHVLTLAQCVTNKHYAPLNPVQVLVDTGSTFTHCKEADFGKTSGRYPVERIFVHERYGPGVVPKRLFSIGQVRTLKDLWFLKKCFKTNGAWDATCPNHKPEPSITDPRYNVALLRTSSKIQFGVHGSTGGVDRIDLPPRRQNLDIGDDVYAAGFGLRFKVLPYLHVAKLKFYDYATCKYDYKKRLQKDLNVELHICAGYARPPEKRNGTCGVDRGGPLIRYLSDGSKELVGMTLDMTDDCANPETSDVFIQVTYFRNWIREKMDLE